MFFPAVFPLVKDEPENENEQDKHISDDELNNEPETEIVHKPSFSKVLALLMMNYASDSEGEVITLSNYFKFAYGFKLVN